MPSIKNTVAVCAGDSHYFQHNHVKGDKGTEETRPTPAPISTAETSEQVADELHGKGTCDLCHEAPTLEKMRSGNHKLAFERDPDLHKNICRNCHQVSSFCGKCHPVPEAVMG